MNYDIQAFIMRSSETYAINTKSLWPNAWVLKTEDLIACGKPKNIVTESYAEADGLKVWTPTAVAHEATDVKITLCFIGETMYDEYDDFVQYVDGKVFKWWDSVRRRVATLLLLSQTKPNESFEGNVQYIEAEFTFKNVVGKPSASNDAFWVYEWGYESGEFVCVKVYGTNNGKARSKALTFTRASSGTTEDFDFCAAFTWDRGYAALDDTDLQTMTASIYAERLTAFNGYVLDWMNTHYGDFAGMITDIRANSEQMNTQICPLS